MDAPANIPQQSFLDDAGLNRQYVFDIASLPAELTNALQARSHERQLILFGHGGRRLWECVTAQGLSSPDPIDEYSVRIVRQWLAQSLPAARIRFVYPGGPPVGLQQLGELAGWHHPSPFMVGVDAKWGSWSAYRVAILTDTALPPSQPVDHGHPCPTCQTPPCIQACPAGALAEGHFNLATCSTWRLQPDSPCANNCPARLACPAGAEHRYDPAQIRHSYTRSLHMIRAWLRPTDVTG